MIINQQDRPCHSERSEESHGPTEILSAAKNDMADLDRKCSVGTAPGACPPWDTRTNP